MCKDTDMTLLLRPSYSTRRNCSSRGEEEICQEGQGNKEGEEAYVGQLVVATVLVPGLKKDGPAVIVVAMFDVVVVVVHAQQYQRHNSASPHTVSVDHQVDVPFKVGSL